MNSYSPTWFSLFMDAIPPAQTASEVAFLRRQLPLAGHRRVLDLCCGIGRHANALAGIGYDVLGIDADEAAVRKASAGQARFIVADARSIASLNATFDAAMILWQSFGYFDARANLQLLVDLRSRLRPDARLILDVYNRRFFASRLTARTFQRGDRTIIESKEMTPAGRLSVRLDYGTSADTFDWQVFDAMDLEAFASRAGFALRLACREFDESKPPADDSPRMQLIFDAAPG